MKCSAKICQYLTVWALVAVLSLMLYTSMRPFGVFFDINRYNADAKKAPLQHKYSNWIGNGQALRKYLPDLLAQAKGLNSRNIKAYLIIDQNVKTFLANTAPTPEELTAIHTIFHNYDLQPPTNAHNYAEYCQQNGLILINDTDVFDTLERELSEHYIPEFRKMYNEHLQAGYKNGKDYAFAGDILRIAAIQHIGQAGEVVMYTDTDIAIDYRQIKKRMPFKQQHFNLVTKIANHVAGPQVVSAKNLQTLQRYYTQTFLIDNDVLVVRSKLKNLKDVISFMMQWRNIQNNTKVYHFFAQQDESNPGELVYKMYELRLYDFAYNTDDALTSSVVNFLSHEDVAKIQAFVGDILPEGYLTANADSMQASVIASLSGKGKNEENFYQAIKPVIDSGQYLMVHHNNLLISLPFFVTYGALTSGGANNRIIKAITDTKISERIRAKVIRSVTVNPESLGIFGRKDVSSWRKVSWYQSTESIFPTINTQEEFEMFLRANPGYRNQTKMVKAYALRQKLIKILS